MKKRAGRKKRRKNGRKPGKGKGIKDADREIGKTEAGTKLRKKEKEFWDYVGKFDVVGQVETWVRKKNWEKLKETTTRICVGVSKGDKGKEKGESKRGK
ncbi:hypothetical protein Zmor_011665 [Zophobas morio]|uniref:Uncharacterized protein n=1 Tax=Zophobas morio TaxID=2755281 RepID=A0AA38ML74_9CUCU|nr:hypothetical protein Zmor_011665 [Zophobas morio]